MLQELHVKNLALIQEASLQFENGFHALTGETGAGKSLLLGSVNLALGQKASSDLIRKDADYALSELIFYIDNPRVKQSLIDMEINVDEDNMVILQRKIQGSKSVCRINGETYPLSKVKDVAGLLIDIHGQHEHQSLLKKANHKRILDDYAGDELALVLSEISKFYDEYKRINQILSQEKMDDMAKERQLELLRHEISEIESANLSPLEDEELEHVYHKMINAKKITESLNIASSCMGGGFGTSDVDAAMLSGRALKEISSVTQYDESLANIEKSIADIESLISDVNHSLSDYISSLSFNEEEFYRTEERLNEINRLKSRYGNTIEEVISYKEEREAELAKFEDFDAYIANLLVKLEDIKGKLLKLCEKASSIRREAAKELCAKMQEALMELNFLSADFEIKFDEKEPARDGFDDIEFMISLNPGEETKPLAGVASGGELSRIMLALRYVSAARDEIGTLIFDEVDAGISGRTAMMVAKKLSSLSKNCQVICITHLPQIASFADVHFLIEKKAENNTTTTTICNIEGEDRILELARLLGDTESARQNAQELLDNAKGFKV